MDRLKIEELAKKCIELKAEREALQSKEKTLRDELKSLLKSDNKTYFVFGDYAIEIKKKYIKTILKDFESKIPKEYFNIRIVEQMFIKRKQDIELVGNKFILKKKDIITPNIC